jgi:hypothetical protein
LLWLLAGCGSSEGPPKGAIERVARSLFERAARGEEVPVPIPFTGEGPATPRLTATEVISKKLAPRRGTEYWECEVRLTYLNKIEQLETATIRILFAHRGELWQPAFLESEAR